MSRIERLAALLDEPLLVTSLVNVRYLTGLSSSNAAVLVYPGGDATLFTDFRYAQKAQAIDGVTFQRTARAVIPDLANKLGGRTIWIEAHALTVAASEILWEHGVATVPQTGNASTSRPATRSCRSGEAPNTTSPSPPSM